MKPVFQTWIDKAGTRQYSLGIRDIKVLSTWHSQNSLTNEINMVNVTKADIIQFIESIHLEWARAQAAVSEQEAKHEPVSPNP